MAPINISEVNCGVQLSWSAPATGCGNVLNYKIEIQTNHQLNNDLVQWTTLSECSTLSVNNLRFSCNIKFKTLKSVYQMREGLLIQVRGYAQNATGW